jgi:hypothetical protein
MSRGNRIIITTEHKGRKLEGIVGAGISPKPGTIMQIDVSEALIGGRFTFELYNADADGGRPKGPFIVLLEDIYQGKTVNDAYTAGDHCFGYVPLPGDELNLLVANIAGTGDDHVKGETLIVDDTTGLLVATASTPETEVAMLLEDITDPTADTLAWCIWNGY